MSAAAQGVQFQFGGADAFCGRLFQLEFGLFEVFGAAQAVAIARTQLIRAERTAHFG